MRIRNNKVNVFLSDDEKFILKRDSSRLNLSQSEYIRNLIIGYDGYYYTDDGLLKCTSKYTFKRVYIYNNHLEHHVYH